MRSMFRTVIAALVAVLAMSAVAASMAAAADPTTQQEFVEQNGHEVIKKGFTSTSGVATFRSTGWVFVCQKAKTEGKLVGKESVEKVVVTFTECQEPAKKCPFRSKGAQNEGEIVTQMLKGEVGEVATTEATSGVGLLLEGESSNVIATLEPEKGCFPMSPTNLEGSVVGEVTPLTLGKTDNLDFKLSRGVQNIRKFERSAAKHCAGAFGSRPCEADKSFQVNLKLIGKTWTIESQGTNTFEEELKVNMGV